MAKLQKEQIESIKKQLDENGQLPHEWRWRIFPPEKQEYELVYAAKQREEDIIAQTMAVPLQTVRTFKNGTGKPRNDKWYNKLIFGDNLQAMKSLLNDPKIAGKVSLVYIDPPFATKQEFRGSNDQKAYQDKVAGAEFIEFLRRRLVLLRELLAPDGAIYVHLDQKKVHYAKLIMDEVFGESNFRNEIIWHYKFRMMDSARKFNKKHDTILFYAKSEQHEIAMPKEAWTKEDILARRKQEVHVDKEGREWLWMPGGKGKSKSKMKYIDEIIAEGKAIDDVWDMPIVTSSAIERTGYPTQKPERLIERIVNASSKPGDIVMDVFSGSGTTLAVSEKLERRWIGIDCGKLAIYTTQHRMLNLSKEIGQKGPKRNTKPFILQNSGLYDFESLKDLPWEDWRFFALQLFECRDKPHNIAGLQVDGEKGRSPVLVYDWKTNRGQTISEETIEDIHAMVGKRIGKKFYIIAPMMAFDFFQDYIDLDGIRYYALRIPYSMIQELHRRAFEAVLQARGEGNVNDIQEAYGFSFMVAPEVQWEAKIEKPANESCQWAALRTRKFVSKAVVKGSEQEGHFETFAMLMLDLSYDGSVFDLDMVLYGDELEKQKWVARFRAEDIGEQIMAIWIDYHGNESKAVITRAEFGLANAASKATLKSSKQKGARKRKTARAASNARAKP